MSAEGEGPGRAALRALANPSRALYFLTHPAKLWLRLRRKDPRPLAEVIAELAGIDGPELAALAAELREWLAQREDVAQAFARRRGRAIVVEPWQELFYALVRRLRPATMVETGVFDGHSSLCVLAAMERNGEGALVSIDLPAAAQSVATESTDRMRETMLPPGEDPGWIVPEDLRPRWRLVLGDAREELPRVLAELERVDIFFHDSLHTYEHMLWEFRTAWPALRDEGLLLSDDIGWNDAFFEFALSVARPYGHDFRTGVIRK